MLIGILKRAYIGKGDTKLFTELPPETSSAILKRIQLSPNETPLIVSFAEDGSWFLISNCNFHWICEKQIGQLSWDLLESVESPMFGYAGKTIDPYLILKSKGEAFKVKVELRDGKYMIWRLLEQIVAQRKRAEEK